MAKKDAVLLDVVLVLLMTLKKIRMILDAVDGELVNASEKCEGGGVSAKEERHRIEYTDPIMAASVRGGGRRMAVKKKSVAKPSKPVAKKVKR